MTYYPGSKQPRKQYPKEAKVLPAVPGKDDQPGSLGTPRVFTVGARDVEVFTVGHLAQAVGRKSVSIRRWEQDGVIPIAPYFMRGKANDTRGQRRYYGRAHIEGIVQIAKEEGILDDLRKPISETNFSQRVHQLFRELASP